MQIGDKIRQFRKHLELTLEEFSEPIGCKKAHLSDIERNESGPSLDLLEQIIKKHRIDARYFFTDTMTPDQADLRQREDELSLSQMERVIQRLDLIENKQRPLEKIDPIAERVMINQDLHDLVDLIKYWDGNMIRRFKDAAYFYISGIQASENIEKEREPESDPDREAPLSAIGST